MKVTVECDGSVGVAQEDDLITLTDAIQLFERAAKACGYCFKGSLELTETEGE
jgi:hypothetical protein